MRKEVAAHGLPLFLCLCVSFWSYLEILHCSGKLLDPQEVEALKKIGSKLGKQWNFSVDPCTGTFGWVDPAKPNPNSPMAADVSCDLCKADYCHITSIILRGQNLTGFLPNEFSNLTFLRVIDLTRNYLAGSIPVSWASLPLTNLGLEGNMIQGQIPWSFGKLINLKRILISANNLTGKLPESLGNLTNIVFFRIDGNPISGNIPDFIGNWKKLDRLDMQGTSMEGPFPANFFSSATVTQLRVTDLRGGYWEFPQLTNITNIKKLVLRNLSLSGELPNDIGELTSLHYLDVSFNNLTGEIPESWEYLKNLKHLYLTNNSLTGEIPDWKLKSGNNIDLSYNSFNGSNAPDDCPSAGNLNLVSSYSASENNSIAPCLRRNYPCSGKAKNYNLFINCGGDQKNIDGDEYQADTDTGGASYYNSFNEKWAISSTGDFVDNGDEKYIAKNSSALNISNPELYMTARLSPLALTYYGLCLQNGNYTVKLHFAEIMFADNHTFSSVGRRIFDAYIQGEKVLPDFNIAKEANGNERETIRSFNAKVDKNTLEIHFQWTGKGTNAIPHRNVYGPLISAISVTPNFKPDKGGLSVGAILGIVAAGCVAIAIISTLIWLFLRRRKYDENNGLELQAGYYSLRQIKAATRNFHATNKLGEGGFGPVHKGVLSDGTLIAVKQLSSKSSQGNREFVNEIGMISALQHPNLVKLFGCCIEGNQLLLVYEYMENNSLANALFSSESDRLNLDWQTRRKICLDIAQGLSYLHEESTLKIVHRDIKATNVLLDKDLNAKISDFGLARLSGDDESHISTRIAGTIGYMAPEYALRGYLTDKADVYSFGVVMLEIISGMSNATCIVEDDSVYLLEWAYVLQKQGNLLELVDKSLGTNCSEEEALQMLNLALDCTNPSPSLRPTMSAVVSILDCQNSKQVSSSIDDTGSHIFGKLSRESQSASVSMDVQWVDSSVSAESSSKEHTRWYSATMEQVSGSSA
ncbi:probable LRR receptor-like serine/threonine-protein kinase At1g53440 isoform X3 [Dioscorea cayenensis subsp. rotundata]|uniref:non-specific serine/threonine protein kinase n=1 Tax=Dioscorea cayennensis subsp. rotundata TaxID=55577 RepID=A0AB40AM14_DIOCR|nr:probable LRR receptor-like serine/threonine-protein kinase At1g53440 isoform X3 [Dioscorea cayenensis subsp. rotundata]